LKRPTAGAAVSFAAGLFRSWDIRAPVRKRRRLNR
jgi:hypothetical protein